MKFIIITGQFCLSIINKQQLLNIFSNLLTMLVLTEQIHVMEEEELAMNTWLCLNAQ